MIRSFPGLFLLLVAGVFLLRLPVAAQAESAPIYCPLTGHWYQPVAAGGIGWEQAKADAAARTHQGQRGYLATLTSAEENNWVRNYLPQAAEGGYYLGGYQPPGSPEPSGNWKWVTGEPWRFTLWNAGEPNDGAASVENCLALVGNGEWNDMLASGAGGYLIEYGSAPPPNPLIAFAPPVSYEINGPGKVDSFDFDMDGHLDLAVSSSNDVALMYGLGDGRFGAPTFLGVGTGVGETVATDVNRDGKTDLVTAGGDSLYVYLSTGGRNYARQQRYVLGTNVGAVHSADFNGDQYPDMAVVVNSGNCFAVLLNKGDGKLAEPTFYPAGSWPGYIAGGDWNRDGKHDLAVTSVVDGNLSLYMGNGAGGFTHGGGMNTGGEYPVKIVADDFDGDGIADLIVGNTFSHSVGLLFGNGNGTFQTSLTYVAAPYPYTLVTVDLDGDGDPDIATPNNGSRQFSVLRNMDGLPGLTIPFPSGGDNSRNLTAGDFNEDGKPDLAVASESTHNVTIHLNETGMGGSGAPAPPAAPRNLQAAAFSATEIQLAWQDTSNNESGFRIERKTDTTSFAQVDTAPANTTLRQSRGLVANTRYTYRVRAYNAGGTSAYTNQASATISIPTAPTNFRATVLSASLIQLDWTDTSNNERNFQLERRTAGKPYEVLETLPANTKTFWNDRLEPQTVFVYRLRALGAHGNSAYTPEVRAETLPAQPNAPTELKVPAAETRAITFTWRDNSNNETGFEVERQAGRSNPFTRIATTGVNATGYVDRTFAVGVQNVYRVRAINRGVGSAYSNPITITVYPKLIGFTIRPAAVKGGKAATVTLTVDVPSPAGTPPIRLSSRSPLAPVPAEVLIPVGKTIATFRIKTKKTKKTKSVIFQAKGYASVLNATLKVKK